MKCNKIELRNALSDVRNDEVPVGKGTLMSIDCRLSDILCNIDCSPHHFKNAVSAPKTGEQQVKLQFFACDYPAPPLTPFETARNYPQPERAARYPQ